MGRSSITFSGRVVLLRVVFAVFRLFGCRCVLVCERVLVAWFGDLCGCVVPDAGGCIAFAACGFGLLWFDFRLFGCLWW